MPAYDDERESTGDLWQVSERHERVDNWQLSLFEPSAVEVVAESGIRLGDFEILYRAGLLSQNPRSQERSDAGFRAEVAFLGKLLAAGFDARTIQRMVSSLEYPYRYHPDNMHYDLLREGWITLRPVSTTRVLDEAMARLREGGDRAQIAALAHAAIDALAVDASGEE